LFALIRLKLQLCLFLSLAACAVDAARGPAESPPAQPPEQVVEEVGKGDVIEVKVFMEPELEGIYPIGLDGAIRFPLIGPIEVVGKDATEIAVEIQSRLAQGYLKDPQVTVHVREHNSQRIHVLGQVEKAGTFGYRVGMSVIEAISVAGGFTKLAATNRVRVTRKNGPDEKVYEIAAGDVSQGRAPNFPLEPGDIVYVPEAIF
jgi:protein involved in polysaccharide export with SLBB domain